MQIIVQLNADAAKSVQAGDFTSPSLKSLGQTLSALCLNLSPMFYGATDPELSRFFVADVDDVAAKKVVEQLLQHSDVQAAYFHPPTEPA